MTALDPYDVRRVLRGDGLLREFNDAGVLAAADVHVALRLAALGGERDEWVALAAALAVRGPRLGHVFVDLATIRDTATVEADEPVDLSGLPWPAAEAWTERVAASGLVAVGEKDADSSRPLRLAGTWLYLDRYWREERQIAADLRALGEAPPAGVREDLLADGLARLFTDDRQRLAAESAVRRRLAVVAGGPGTGKTTTVARIVAVLLEQAPATTGSSPLLVALAAPTGKAAARLEEAVHEEAATLAVAEPVRAGLRSLKASTLHRLLGWRPDSRSRFRHHRANRLPHDVVVVDETSMVSLSLMARLVEAVRPDARLVLVGDPGQLTSIEAGAVLGDIVAGAREGVVVLERVHRFGGGIARLAEAIRRGDAGAVLEALAGEPEGVTWIPVDVGDPAAAKALAPVRDGAVSAARAVMDAARRGA
ncbi:MAG: AAA family ATPase, partial [Solirubrobacteraceae bacterium]